MKNNNPSTRQFSINFLFICCIIIGSFIFRSVIADEQLPENSPTIKSSIVGGEITPRIIGGTASKEGDWPWMTGILLRPNGFLFCGGTLIKDKWVLTAAHCLYDISLRPLQPEEIDTLIGRSRLSTTDGEWRLVKQIIRHPLFNPSQPDSAFDIALLELQIPSTYPPIQTLGNFSVQDDPGKLATALGWGTTSTPENTFPNDLHQVTVPIVSNEVCNQAMGGIIKDNMLCAGFAAGGKDSCIGDSGGPLVVFDTESQSWRQAGITSFGIGCAQPGVYGVYTRLEMFKDFISSTICSGDDIPGTPQLDISIHNHTVTASWNPTFNAEGYRLNYAPYPALSPIYSMDMNDNTSISVGLNSGDAFFVAIDAYNHNCRSPYSNVEYFVVP